MDQFFVCRERNHPFIMHILLYIFVLKPFTCSYAWRSISITDQTLRCLMTYKKSNHWVIMIFCNTSSPLGFFRTCLSSTNQGFCTLGSIFLVLHQSFRTIDLLRALYDRWSEKKIRYWICDFSWYHSMFSTFYLLHILFCIINSHHRFLVHPFSTVDLRSGAGCKP